MSEKKSVIQAFGGWVGVALMVTGLAAVLGYEWWQRQGSGDAMQAVAAELGLNVTGVGKRFQMRGQIDGIAVAVDTTTELSLGEVRYYTSFKLYAPSGPSGRMVGADLRQQMIDDLTGEQRMLTGDPAFDDEIFVSGDPAEILAYLDAEARAAILLAAEAGWSFEGATWSALEAGRITDPEEIRTLLTLGLGAVRATRLDSDIETALRERAERDPVAGVRIVAGAARGSPVTAAEPAGGFSSSAEALAALDQMGSESAFAAALFLAEQGDDSDAVRMALVGALVDSQRQAQAIEALAKVGNRLDVAVLGVVRGEHEAAAKAAIVAIETRLPLSDS